MLTFAAAYPGVHVDLQLVSNDGAVVLSACRTLSHMIGMYNQEYGMLMAGTLVSVLPVVILFLLLQKEFVAGLDGGCREGLKFERDRD